MEKSLSINSSGIPSTKKIFGDMKRYYISTFTWERQKHFWPVYIYWLIWLSHLYLSLLLFAVFLVPGEDWSIFFTKHHPYYAQARSISLDFFTLLSLLLCPYFLILKKYGYAAQAAVYFVGIYFGTAYLWQFAYESYVIIIYDIVCSEDAQHLSFCNEFSPLLYLND